MESHPENDVWEVGGLTLATVAHGPMATVSHDSRAGLCLVVEGTLVERTLVDRWEAMHGTLAIYPAGTRGLERKGLNGGAQCFEVRFASAWLHHLRQCGITRRLPVRYTRVSRAIGVVQDIYREMIREGGRSATAVAGLTMALIAELRHFLIESQGDPSPPWLRRVREELDAHPERTLNRNALALRAKVHPVHLSREFRRYYGVTLRDYARRLRVESLVRRP